MSSGTDALYGFAADDPRRLPPQAVSLKSRTQPQSILGLLALAFVATACGFTVYAHVGGGQVAAVAPDLAPASVQVAHPAATTISASAIIEESFAAIRYRGLLDARNFRFTPGKLSRGAPATLAEHFAAPALPAALKSQDRFTPSTEAPRQTAQTVPLPAGRPTRLAALQDPAAPAPAAAPLNPAPKGMVEDKATVLALISSNKNSLFQRLFGKLKPERTTLAYAAPDGGVTSDAQTILFDGMPKYDQWTAVYDISARTVYLPDGTELEAHSGLGKRMDDPRYVHVKMQGATPPHVYNLSMREALFHGVEALRLTPVGGDGRIFGRKGLLTHTYLLGPRGDSNGCISFKNYDTFLQAYKKGLIKRLVVVPRLA